MHCPGCNMPLDEEGAFCGYCGEQLPAIRPHSPVQMRAPGEAPKMGYVKPVVQWQNSAMGDVQVRPAPSQSSVNFRFDLHGNSRTPLPIDNMPTPIPPASSSIHNPIPTRPFRTVSGTGRNVVFLGIILMILLVGLLAGALTLFQHKQIPSRYTMTSAMSNVGGSISFSDAPVRQGTARQVGSTNSVNISINGLKPPPAGSHYAAWIIDEETEHISSLGTVTQKGSASTVNFQRGNLNVLSMGNKLEITQENAQTTLPTGHVMLSASFPALALVHIKHLLVSFPGTPGNIGLLVGLRGQVQQLHNQTQLLKAGGDNESVACVAQNVVNLIEGRNGDQAQPLDPICATKNIMAVDDGYGLLGNKNNGYVPAAAMHASLAATQPDTTDTIRFHARQVIDATDNLTTWLKAIDQDAQSLLANPGDTNKLQDMLQLSEQSLNGIDLNHNGRVDPVKGEAGANSAYAAGQAMATLTLLPAA